MLKLCKINACLNGTLGIHLSRAPYDPYPWVSGVLENSSASQSGIKIGDTVLECNGTDVLGWKISELAIKIRNHWDGGGKTVNFLIWRNKSEGNNVTTPAINQQSLQKFATCLQNIAQLLECPICLEVIKPPGWQCCNGHVLCNSCRNRSVKCPICRVPFGPRGRCLLSDKLFTLLAETFPCDRSKNAGNKTRRCPEESHKTKKNNISKKIPSPILTLPSPQTILETRTNSTTNNINRDRETETTNTTTSTRVITVGDETRTSPVKNRISGSLKISPLPISQEEIRTNSVAAVLASQPNQRETIQSQSTTTNITRLIPVPTTSRTETTLGTTTNSTSTVSLQPVLISETMNTSPTATPPIQLTTAYTPSISSTVVNYNPNRLTEKLEKQIISLKVKSKSSENLESFAAKNNNTKNEGKLLYQWQQTTSLPASPVSNLVNSKKIIKATSKITSGCESSLPMISSQGNDETLLMNSILSRKVTETPTLRSSDSLKSTHRSFHCPTGKSSCIIEEEVQEIFLNSRNSFRHENRFIISSDSLLANMNLKKHKQSSGRSCNLDEKQIPNVEVVPEAQKNSSSNLDPMTNFKNGFNLKESIKNYTNSNINSTIGRSKTEISSSDSYFIPHLTNYEYSNFNNQKNIKPQIHSRILNHLKCKHKISLCQYHCGYDEKIPIDLKMINNKSNILMCISIDNNYNDDDGTDDSGTDGSKSNNENISMHTAESIYNSNMKILAPSTSSVSLPSALSISLLPISSRIDDDSESDFSDRNNICNNCSTCCNTTFNNLIDDDKIIKKQNEIVKSSNVILHNCRTIKELQKRNIKSENGLSTLKFVESPRVNEKFSTTNTLRGTKFHQNKITGSCTNFQINKSFSSAHNPQQSNLDNLQSATLFSNHYRPVYKENTFESRNSNNTGHDYKSIYKNDIVTSCRKTPITTTSKLPRCNNISSKTFCTAKSKEIFATKSNCNCIPNAQKYTISIQHIKKFHIKSELFFIIKIPLKCCYIRNSSNHCNSIENIEKKFISIKNANNNMMDNSQNTISYENLTKKDKNLPPDNNNNKNSNKSNIAIQKHHEHRVHNFKINQKNNNVINMIPSTSSVTSYVQHISEPSATLAPLSSSIESSSCIYKFQQHCLHNNNPAECNNKIDRQHFKCNQHKILENIDDSNQKKNTSYQTVAISNHNNIVNNKDRFCCCCNIFCNFCFKKRADIARYNNSLDGNYNKLCTDDCNLKKSSSTSTSTTTSTTLNCNTPRTLPSTSFTTNNKPSSEILPDDDDATNINSTDCNENSCCSCSFNYCSCNNIKNPKNLCNHFKGKSAVFIWYCGGNDDDVDNDDDELNVKNFRAVIECCNIITKRDNDESDFIHHHIMNGNNNDVDDNDKNIKCPKLYSNCNNKISMATTTTTTNKNSNDANKCIHNQVEQCNFKNTKTLGITSSSLPDYDDDGNSDYNDDDVDHHHNQYDSNSDVNDRKISLWIHPMTKSWNSIRNQMKFHLVDDDEI